MFVFDTHQAGTKKRGLDGFGERREEMRRAEQSEGGGELAPLAQLSLLFIFNVFKFKVLPLDTVTR